MWLFKKFLEGTAKTSLIAAEASLDAEIEYRKRELEIQAERNRILAQRNAVIENKLSKLRTPQNVGEHQLVDERLLYILVILKSL